MNSEQIKRIANSVVLCLFVISVFMIFKCSDLPNLFSLRILEKPKYNVDIIMSIATSFFVTAVFYFIMYYFPDLIREKEKKEERLPKTRLVHREVQLCIIGFVSLWKDIIEEAQKVDRSIPDPTSLKTIFQADCLVKSANVTMLSAPSNRINLQLESISWNDIIVADLDKFCNHATTILHYYLDILPGDVTYSLFYLLNESIACGNLVRFINIMIRSNNTNDLLLSTCIPTSYSTGRVELEDTCKAVLTICEWVNNEYELLQKTPNTDNKGFNNKISIPLF